jgi:TRAP-type C4-dicarboxylate transport system substrate-binding protein
MLAIICAGFSFRSRVMGAAGFAGIFASLIINCPAAAEEVTLRAISAFALDTQFGVPFKRFVDETNERGKGILQIQLLGGPEAMPPAEAATALRNGVVDIAWTPPNYYENLMPEANAVAFGNQPPSAVRKNGGWDFLNELHAEKVNAYLLTSFGWGIQHHLYLSEPIEKLDLSGLKVRPAPGMQPFFAAFGASNVSMMPGEVYTALERNVIDGYSWPKWGVTDLGWHTVTKQRIDPGYGGVQVNALVNLDTWNALEQAQRDFLDEMAAWFEEYAVQTVAETTAAEEQKQVEAGIQVLTLTGAEERRWTETFSQIMWKSVEEKAPENAAKLKSFVIR